MLNTCFASMRPALVSVGLLVIATVGPGESPAHGQSSDQREDARACTSFGLSYNTRGFRECIGELQRRRGSNRLTTLEEMAITSQIAKDGQIMAERARLQRCDRNPDRRECRRR